MTFKILKKIFFKIYLYGYPKYEKKWLKKIEKPL